MWPRMHELMHRRYAVLRRLEEETAVGLMVPRVEQLPQRVR